MNNFLKFLSPFFVIVLFMGCYSSENTAAMILQGKILGEEHEKFYTANKAQIDNIINETLVKIAQKKIAKVDLSDDEKAIHDYNQNRGRASQLIIEESKRLSKEGKMAYRRINGGLGIFDTSGVYKKFGFRSGDRILTKWGEATVIGILEGDDKLWFHIDGKKGASFWSEIREKDFKLIKSAERNAKQENKSSLESRATDTVNTTKDNNIESVGSLEKDVYLLGEMIPLIQPITN